MMDYEKKYKEALERAKDFKNGIVQFALDPGESIVHYIFPELRESEDERIRKELIEFIKWSVDRHFMREDFHQAKRPSEWIAYLEKQKVPEGLHPEEYPLTPDECVKPVEWGDKDKEMLMRCIAAIPVQGDEIMPTSYLNKLRNWLEFLPERFNLPPKQEWSEEDDKMLARIIERGQSQIQMFETGLLPEHIAWLKSLRPQPHWKPSEEQIEALKFAVKLYKDTHFENNHEKIVSLYEQLKKLM